eukprot:1083539-Rhodomonas_salina.2
MEGTLPDLRLWSIRFAILMVLFQSLLDGVAHAECVGRQFVRSTRSCTNFLCIGLEVPLPPFAGKSCTTQCRQRGPGLRDCESCCARLCKVAVRKFPCPLRLRGYGRRKKQLQTPTSPDEIFLPRRNTCIPAHGGALYPPALSPSTAMLVGEDQRRLQQGLL